MHLTLPKWLQTNLSIPKQEAMTNDDSLTPKTMQTVFNQQKDSSQTTSSLNYLDDYIHQHF